MKETEITTVKCTKETKKKLNALAKTFGMTHMKVLQLLIETSYESHMKLLIGD